MYSANHGTINKCGSPQGRSRCGIISSERVKLVHWLPASSAVGLVKAYRAWRKRHSVWSHGSTWIKASEALRERRSWLVSRGGASGLCLSGVGGGGGQRWGGGSTLISGIGGIFPSRWEADVSLFLSRHSSPCFCVRLFAESDLALRLPLSNPRGRGGGTWAPWEGVAVPRLGHMTRGRGPFFVGRRRIT